MTRRTLVRTLRIEGAPIAAALAIGVLFAAPVAAQHARWGADYFPDVALTTHEGKTVRFYDDVIKGKIVAIDLIYTTCQYACPLETARLAQVQRVLGDRVGKDIFFYSITIDPEHDTPEVLKAYAEKYHVGPGWLFLTGKAADIEHISRKLGLYSDPDPNDPDGHTPMLLVGNEATGQWMRNSALDNPRFLATTIGDWMNSWENGPKQALQSFADAPALDVDEAAHTFRNHCGACHTIGGGDAIGPDLKGVAAARERRWLTRFIAAPDALFAEHDPTAAALLARYNGVRMPNLSLSDRDASMLVDYIARESRANPPPSAGSLHSADGLPAAGGAVDLRPILEPYLRIHEALAADRITGVSEYAGMIATEAVRIGSSAAGIRLAVNPFAQADDVRTAREAFAALSDAVIAFARATGSALGDHIAVAYCPMARKRWLQKGETIRNPFYGAQMPDCGRIVEP